MAFLFLQNNIWQTCLFLPNSIKICQEQKDFSARFSDKSETVFLGAFSLLALKMSAVPPNCSLYEILQSPCGFSREEVEHVLLSGCNADISAHFEGFVGYFIVSKIPHHVRCLFACHAIHRKRMPSTKLRQRLCWWLQI